MKVKTVSFMILCADHKATENTDNICDQCQHRHANCGGDNAGRDQIFMRIGGERCQRVNLFGDAHGANLSRNGGGDATGNHQATQYRAKLAGDAQRDNAGDNRL